MGHRFLSVAKVEMMFWLFVMSLLVSKAASQCTFDDRLLESSVSRNALEQNWVKFVRHNGKTIVPFYFTRETTLSTQKEMRKIFLQIEKEMGDGCPIQFVQTNDANDKRANIHIKQDSKKCGSQYEVCEHCGILKSSPYECDSLMHYQDTTFSIDSDHKKTMISINEKLCPSKVLSSINDHATKNDWNMLRFRLGCLS